MAPEQGENNVADPRSDVYSLGTIMYEALTGAPPFNGNNAMQVILDHVHKPVPPLKVPAGLEVPPPHLVQVVMKSLAKSPMDRFQSMDELLAALGELASPERYLTPNRGVQAQKKRSSALTVGLFLAAAALGSVVTAMLVSHGREAVQPVVEQKLAEPPPPVKPAALATIMFHIDSTPQGATVTMGARKMGVTPVDFELPAGPDGRTSADVHLELPGYVALDVSAGGSGPRIDVMQKLQLLPPEKVVEKVVVEKVVVPAAPAQPPAKKKSPRSAQKLIDEEFNMPSMPPPAKGDTLKKPK
jgi:serine/threonine-protein kinase